MKTKRNILLAAVLTFGIAGYSFNSKAQTVNTNLLEFPTIVFNGIKIPAIIGTPITVQGQTITIQTNASGDFTIVTSGPNGTNSITPPHDLSGAMQFVQNAVEKNNPANIGYYPTNGEWVLSVAGVFAQNSGQAAAQLSIEKYGIIPKWANLSLGVAVLEGNQNGQNGTAAAYAFGDYRRPIGDVAFSIGLGGGYDNYTGRPMGIVKIEVEYRSSKNLGEFVGVGYDCEGFGSTKTAVGTTISDPSGLTIGGGIRYSFSKLF